jgi:hypothetical protein
MAVSLVSIAVTVVLGLVLAAALLGVGRSRRRGSLPGELAAPR